METLVVHKRVVVWLECGMLLLHTNATVFQYPASNNRFLEKAVFWPASAIFPVLQLQILCCQKLRRHFISLFGRYFH